MGLHKLLEDFLDRPEFNAVKKDKLITLRIFGIVEHNEKLNKEFYSFSDKNTLHKNLPQVIGKKYKLSVGTESKDENLIREYTSLVNSFHYLT